MEKPVVFVIGASGKIGCATVRSLTSNFFDQVSIKAGTRDPDKANVLKSLPGVTLVKACMGDDALVETFTGVSTLYIITPSTQDKVSLVCSTAKSAKEAGVKHLLVASLVTADLTETSLGIQFSEIEKTIHKIGIPYTFLRLPSFMESLFMYKQSIISSSSFQSSLNPDAKFGAVAVADAGDAGATILVQPSQHINTALSIFSDFISYREVSDHFSQILGRKISYNQVPIEDTRKKMQMAGVPEWLGKGLLELVELINNGHPVITSGDVGILAKITGNSPTDMKTWIGNQAEYFK